MKSYYKTLFSKEYHAGTPISVIAANYGFSVEEIEKAILPKKSTAITFAVKERNYAPAEVLKKVKQKQAGRKAAETRKRNKLALQVGTAQKVSLDRKLINVTKTVEDVAKKLASKDRRIVELVHNIVGNIQTLLQLID